MQSKIDKEALITELAPKLIWVLRDFTLKRVNPDTGLEISGREYLDICLRKKVNPLNKKIISQLSGKNLSDYNVVRDSIVKYFSDRDCFTLIPPLQSDKDLRNLNNFKLEKFSDGFKTEFLKLKEKIYKEATPKKFNGRKLNGSTLANLIREFVKAVNGGSIPNISTA